MPARGFGEQWHMIVDNLAQSEKFFSALSVVDGVSAAAVAGFNDYIDTNPSDTAHYEFLQSGKYNVTINYDGETMYFVVDYSADFPAFGNQTAQIAMSMKVGETQKRVRIQIGDANALSYELSENRYKFAIKYAGVRRAMFELTKEGEDVTGNIAEFLTVSDKSYESAADFYIKDGYVTAVGNKASGMVAFKGYVCELYSADTGRLLGYEVRETLSSITYNTLWFDLADIGGITSIKYDPDASKFYVNGLSTEWKVKKVGGFSLKAASRRYDIEFRKQYFYADAGSGNITEIEVEVPMLFVQEEVFDTLSDDVNSENNSVNISVNILSPVLSKIESEYAVKVDMFIENKANVSSSDIVEYIGDKVEFGE